MAKIKGLDGIYNLSTKDRDAYRERLIQQGKIGRRNPWSDVDKIYRNQQFIQKYGLEAFEATPWQQRNFIWKRDILYNEANSKYNPYDFDSKKGVYNLNPNKGVGNADTWNQIQNLGANDLDALQELLESDWKPSPILEKEIEKNEERRRKELVELQKAARWAPAMAGDISGKATALDYFTKEGRIKATRDKNDKIFNDIYNKYLNKHEDKYTAQKQQLANDFLKLDSNTLDKKYKDLINEHVPLLAAQYSSNGQFHTPEMDKFGDKEKAELLAKAEVLFKTLPYEDARKQLDNYAHQYISETRSWFRGAALDFSDFINRGNSYLAGYINETIQGIQNLRGNSLVWVDNNGEIISPSIVAATSATEGTYTDSDGKVHRVRKTEISKGDLFRQGKTDSGEDITIPWFNKKDLNDIERFNLDIRDRAGLERARKLGYSPSQLIYAPGEEANIFTEIAKMGIYPLVDGAVMLATGGVGSGVSKLAKARQFIQGTLAAQSIGGAYGNGVYAENYEGNMAKLEEKAFSDAKLALQDNFLDSYEKDSKFKANADKAIKAKAAELKAKDSSLNFNTDGIGTTKAKRDDAYYEGLARQEIMDGYIYNHLEDKVNEIKNSDSYLTDIKEAHESAANAAHITALTDGIKYFGVNNFGWRRFLYTSSAQRAASRTADVASKVGDTGAGLVSKESILHGKSWWKTADGRKFMGKKALSTAWNGGWTNWTDEMQANAGRQMNEDRFSAYLNGEYDEEGSTITYDAIGSYLSGVLKAIPEESTTRAFIVGAGGSVLSFMPNVASIVSLTRDSKTGREARMRWKNGTTAQKLDMLFTNSVLSEYAAQQAAEKDIDNHIKSINKIVDDNDEFRSIRKAVALKQASMDATNTEDKNTITWLDAVRCMKTLKEFVLPNNPRDASDRAIIANEHNKIKEALPLIEKIAEGNFTEEDARDYLEEYYANNPSEVSSEENDAKAINEVMENAKMLKEASDAYDEVSTTLSNIERERGIPIHPIVRDKLIERGTLNTYLEKRANELQEGIPGSSPINVDAAPVIESFGTRSAIESQLKALEKSVATYDSNIEKANKELERLQKSMLGFMLSKKGKYTEEDANTLSEYNRNIENARLQVEYAKAMKQEALKTSTMLESRSNELLQMALSKGEAKILTKDEILHLDPESRARMLDPENLSNYSEEQQAEITALIREINMTDPAMLRDIYNLATIVKHLRANQKAYSTILEHPEAALAQIESLAEFHKEETTNAINFQRASNISRWINSARSHPDYTEDKIQQEMFSVLRRMKPEFVSFLSTIKSTDGDLGIISEYSDVIQRSRDWANFSQTISRTAKEIGLTQEELSFFLRSIDNVIRGTNSMEEAIAAIQNVLNSTEVSDVDKGKFTSLLKAIDKTINTDNSTKTETKKEAERRVEEQHKKEAEETKAKEELSKDTPDLSTPINEETVTYEDDEVVDFGEEKEQKTEHPKEEPIKEETKEEMKEEAPVEVSPVNEEEGQYNSPTIEEQVQETKNKDNPSEIVELSPDVTDEGNKLPEPTSDNMQGNVMYRYDVAALQEDRTVVERKGEVEGDAMDRFFAWMSNAGIELQQIIDKELRKIIKVNPKIEFLRVNPKDNATDDATLEDKVLLCVEYTDKVAKRHKESRGGVVDANGKKYLIVGTLGFARNNIPQRTTFNELKRIVKNNSKEYFRNNPTERFFVDPTVYTEVEKIGSGRLARQLLGETEQKDRKLSDILADAIRNPDKLDWADLKWMIQYETKYATVNVSDRNVIHTPTDAIGNKGNTFILVEGANGEYSPIYILPTRLNEIEDGKLKQEIDSLINRLCSTNYADRVQAIMPLMHWLYLDDTQNILIGTQDRPTLTIVDNGIKQRTYQLDAADFDATKVARDIYDLNPRINLTIANLQNVNSLKMLDEAGALKTDAAILGTVNASYTVYAVGADGKPIKSTVIETNPTSLEVSSDLAKAQKKLEEREMLGNQRYTLENGQWVNQNGVPLKEIDPALELKVARNHYIRQHGLVPVIKEGNYEYFILDSSDTSPMVYERNITTKEVAKLTGDSAKIIVERDRQNKIQREKEIAAEKENEKQVKMWEENPNYVAPNEEVVELPGELTEEELVSQAIGETVTQTPTPTEEPGAELVKLLEDEKTDRRETKDTGTTDNSNKSLASLQHRDAPTDVSSIVKDRRYSERVIDALLESGFEGDGVDEMISFLQSKNMPITNIKNIDEWIDQLLNCR